MFSDTLVSEFHLLKNHPRILTDYKPKSNKKVWWKCSTNPGHEWEAAIGNRTKGTGCPMCSGRITDKTNNLSIKFPNLAAEWHPSKNTGSPDTIPAGSNKSVWWKCSKNAAHEWEASPNTRTKGKGTGCPHCTGKTTFGGNTVGDKYPHLLNEWDKEKNKDIDPYDICPGSDKKVWWLCPEKKHSYQTKINNRTKGQTKCPICTNRKVVLENSLASVFPDIAIEWDFSKNKKNPEDVLPNCSLQIWWKCLEGHEWQATPTNRTRFLNKCPACSGRIASSQNNLLIAHPDIAAEWHPTKNGEAKPEQFTPSSHSKVWWQCPKNKKHEYVAKVGNRSIGKKSGCPFCKQSKMEKAVYQILREKNIVFESQKKFPDMKFQGRQLSYDFYIPEFQAVIECDGRQHFEEATDYFHNQKTFQHQRLRDIVKNAFAAREGILLLRIAFTEEEFISQLVETFLKRIQRGEKPYNFVGSPYRRKLS